MGVKLRLQKVASLSSSPHADPYIKPVARAKAAGIREDYDEVARYLQGDEGRLESSLASKRTNVTVPAI